MKIHLPNLYNHFNELEQPIHPSLYATQWFITLMSVNLSFEVLMRVWDICFFEGMEFL